MWLPWVEVEIALAVPETLLVLLNAVGFRPRVAISAAFVQCMPIKERWEVMLSFGPDPTLTIPFGVTAMVAIQVVIVVVAIAGLAAWALFANLLHFFSFSSLWRLKMLGVDLPGAFVLVRIT